ncbi:MAG TPA: hypothetical protein VGD01_13360 [Candidatus Elarobacter sp.]|jgi:hypothetical protein
MIVGARRYTVAGSFIAAGFAVVLSLSKGAPPAALAQAQQSPGSVEAELGARVASTFLTVPYSLEYGALPRGFRYPVPAPKLAVLGAAYRRTAGAPGNVRVYYRPSPQTNAEIETLRRYLRRNGWEPSPESMMPNLFVGEYGQTERWCPADLSAAEVDIGEISVDRVAALDLHFVAPSTGTLCRYRRGTVGPSVAVPQLGSIPGLKIEPGIRSFAGPNEAVLSGGTIRGTLDAPEIAARIADRFTALRWTAHPPVLSETTLVQRFAHDDASGHRTAILLIDRRADGVYDAFIEVSGER